MKPTNSLEILKSVSLTTLAGGCLAGVVHQIAAGQYFAAGLIGGCGLASAAWSYAIYVTSF